MARGGKREGAGRPKGSANVRTVEVQAKLDALECDPIEGMAKIALDKSNSIELRASMFKELAMYIAPKRKDRPVELNIPATDTAKGLVKAMGTIIAAVGAGEITPSESTALASLIDAQRRTTETENLARRIAALEQVAPRK